MKDQGICQQFVEEKGDLSVLFLQEANPVVVQNFLCK